MKDGFAEFLSVLKEKSDIVEVLGSYIKLERRGYNYWACCPFHHEKTPSFSVNASDKYYHCFGCGASGDVIGFVKEYENVDFRQAVQILWHSISRQKDVNLSELRKPARLIRRNLTMCLKLTSIFMTAP